MHHLFTLKITLLGRDRVNSCTGMNYSLFSECLNALFPSFLPAVYTVPLYQQAREKASNVLCSKCRQALQQQQKQGTGPLIKQEGTGVRIKQEPGLVPEVVAGTAAAPAAALTHHAKRKSFAQQTREAAATAHLNCQRQVSGESSGQSMAFISYIDQHAVSILK